VTGVQTCALPISEKSKTGELRRKSAGRNLEVEMVDLEKLQFIDQPQNRCLRLLPNGSLRETAISTSLHAGI
jgi:hypothetical protein